MEDGRNKDGELTCVKVVEIDSQQADEMNWEVDVISVLSVQVMAKCVPILQSACSRSFLRAAKTVRAQMTSMDALLAADPDFRVIHLLRDPRGVVASRRATRDDSMIGRYVMAGHYVMTSFLSIVSK